MSAWRRLTPLYDVLTAQPSLDANQIPPKKFKLAMSVGKNRHFAIHDIMPRHFMQTADLAGVGKPAIKALFEDLAARAEPTLTKVVDTLPKGFPSALVDSVTYALKRRARLLADVDSHAE